MNGWIQRLLGRKAGGFTLALIVVLLVANGWFLSLRWQKATVEHAVLPRYHFYAVFPGNNDPFWAEVKKGIAQAATASNLAVEFNRPNTVDNARIQDYLTIARLSRVDGIIAQGSNDPAVVQAIDSAVKAGIPVVTVETDAKNSDRESFIGANNYLVGEQAAKLIIQGTSGKARVAVIMSGNAETDTAAQNSMLNGFLTTLKEAPDARMTKIFTSKPGILNTEGIAQTILREQDVNAIYCVDPLFSVGVAQTVINANEVGRITIVGYGQSPEIDSYIQRGVIYGVVAGNPFKIGYDSIKALLELKEKNHTSSVVDTGISIVTRSTLSNKERQPVPAGNG
ncbi:Periplasmic binding protein domain [Acididesulfobacillus acetoxydans]|uniref:Monosaccharide ABC transporter substrate-binding protein, CUT2 n=1 Tax=Acididesulfobacillus acetoxydans TaxID=1561005 RepID=A0A8S0XV47_9FIRM|nr:substrate-binding domain-containing protein [Acididesulfobacillus acetoxydans]CAA7600007.1 Periplasmic binding protein domain [Acididesulfobacillus acetoxydans]CEJ05993.1 Monosaccharide ABC transporter substrate-binding protein, CUT2 [Acididesulfobacillus acetoxydans]